MKRCSTQKPAINFHPVCFSLHSDVHLAFFVSSHRQRPIRAKTASLSCTLNLCGFRSVCYKSYSYRLLIFEESSPQPPFDSCEIYSVEGDRSRDWKRGYYSPMSSRIWTIVSARVLGTVGETFALDVSSNLLAVSLLSPRGRSTCLCVTCMQETETLPHSCSVKQFMKYLFVWGLGFITQRDRRKYEDC